MSAPGTAWSQITGYSSTAPTEKALAGLPEDYTFNGSYPAVLYMHGWGTVSDPTDLIAYGTLPNTGAVARSIPAAGYPMLYPIAGGNTWGNDTVKARMAEAKTFLQGTMSGKSGKIALVGLSMGFSACMAYALANPTLVSCIVGFNPVMDLNNIHGNATYTASIDAAYGGTYSDTTNGPTHNPLKIAQGGSFPTGVPVQIWAPSDDVTVVPQSTVTAFTTAMGSQCDYHATTGGHSDTALAGVDVPTLLSFLAANA